MRREQPPRLVVGVGGDDVDAEHQLRPLEAVSGSSGWKRRAVDLDRLTSSAPARSATRTRTADPARRRAARRTGSTRESRSGTCSPAPGIALTRWPGAGSRKNAISSWTSCGNVSALSVAPQRQRRDLIAPRRAAESEIDPPRKERLQRAELLGDHQRRVVGQHDAAGADADRRRAAGHVADDHRRRRAGDGRHVVVLGQPVALVAPALGVAARGRGCCETPGAALLPCVMGDEIEDRERRHTPSSRRVPRLGEVPGTRWWQNIPTCTTDFRSLDAFTQHALAELLQSSRAQSR